MYLCIDEEVIQKVKNFRMFKKLDLTVFSGKEAKFIITFAFSFILSAQKIDGKSLITQDNREMVDKII
jgi:hypothetical protein